MESTNESINESLDSWIDKHADIFNRHDISSCKITISKGSCLWKFPENENFPENFTHPGINFYNYPPLILTRNYSYLNPQTRSKNKPNFSLFTFDESKIPNDSPSSSELLESSPPLVSMFSKLDVVPALDQRVDVGMIKQSSLSYYNIKFLRLSSQVRIIEPIVINLFLYDIDTKKKISCIWRIFPDGKDFDRKIQNFFTDTLINAPTEINIPYTTVHNKIILVVFLDRLLLKNGGASLNKYYEKANTPNLHISLQDINQCNQPLTATTFAWSYRVMNEVLPQSDKKNIIFSNFEASQFVNEDFLASRFQNSSSSNKEKVLPFEVVLEIGHEVPEHEKLCHLFDFPIFPHTTYVNELIIQPISAKFKFPRGVHGRNILAEIQIVGDRRPLPIFENNKKMFTTKCQYHVDNPKFNEDIIIKLPVDLPPDSQIQVFFLHASVKPKSKAPREPCGFASFPLFRRKGKERCFIKDGLHKAGISYSNDTRVHATDNNVFVFNTILNSSIYSCDKEINSIFNNNLENINAPESDIIVIPHLYGILDTILANINNVNDDQNTDEIESQNNKCMFDSLMKVLSVFQRDRNHNDSQFLLFYLKFCALRREGEENIHKNLLKMWMEYINNTEFNQKRPDFFNCWFLLELLIKSFSLCDKSCVDYKLLTNLVAKMATYLPNFRESGQNIGASLNKYLALFYKDLFEIVQDHKMIIEMAKNHLLSMKYNDTKCLFDRECFRDFLLCFLSPKIFMYMIAPINENSSLFAEVILPLIESGISFYEHTNDEFKLIFNLLLQFEPQEHKIIASRLFPIIIMIGNIQDVLTKYPAKTFVLYPLIIMHFILYHMEFSDFNDEIASITPFLIDQSQKLSIFDLEKITKITSKINATESINKAVTASLRDSSLDTSILLTSNFPNSILNTENTSNYGTNNNQISNKIHNNANIDAFNKNRHLSPNNSSYDFQEGETPAGAASKRTRKFASLRMYNRADLMKTQTSSSTDIKKTFDALAFCTQSLLIKFSLSFMNINSLNNIIAKLCSVTISPLLFKYFTDSLEQFVEKRPDIFFGDPLSDLKHIIRKLVAKLDEKKLMFLEKCIELEKNIYNNDAFRTNALIVRAFAKAPPSKSIVEICANSSFHNFVSQLYDLNTQLSSDQLRKENSDVYSDVIFRKAELVSLSPDSRVESLIKLTNYHIETSYFSEAVISKLTAAALVAEYLGRLNRIPACYKNVIPSANLFFSACPSAVSEACSDKVARFFPNIRGYCTSKYFSEYGFIYLIMTSMDTCKRASLYELSTKIHILLQPIAEHRLLWQVLKKHFVTGAFAWQIISSFSTSSDRSLGNYYKVQFQNGGTYIYRETNYANMWQLRERLKKTSTYISQGKEIEVLNEGDDLPPNDSPLLDPQKYYIHVKAVSQYFTSEERKKRITVFEQNHNIDRFYFDIPFSKSAQSSIENCYLKRKIFLLPHPLPYIVKRVEVPPENITEIIFTPIQYSCQNLQKQADLIEEAIARKDFKQLQPLIQGSLLVTVNEGPQKIAEVFLRSGNNGEFEFQLRTIFRRFLKVNEQAVFLHADYVKINPVYTILQEELESGINRLTSSLQPYLK
ncbi:Dedicator of cytokinesis family protein [Tritrichomonas foetus]|uniref:Dedicator of cytokinesis family protein n=1 Tax=Tritrichomonas foetus TaxID=1144522 RepID=A0A1J4K0S6_9EUKA|nr:Dedicator of cytokinesis family protein [Tritrichomonas foetus]|eukprot:OHT04851.1 Dedicator of cytokinesis family protein [Tritrichomonas foetus]